MILRLAAPQGVMDSSVVAIAASGDWPALPANMTVGEVEAVTCLLDARSLNRMRRDHVCEDPYGIARWLCRHPGEALADVTLPELFLALATCVAGWAGLDERPREGDEHHAEALALLAAIRSQLAAIESSVVLIPAVLPEARQYALRTPLLDLLFSVRVQNACDRLGLETVRDLVCIDPQAFAAEPNLGRRSMSEVEARVERLLGMSWTQMHALLSPDRDDESDAAIEPLATRASRWSLLRARLPASILSRSPDAAKLPKRLVCFAQARGIETVRGLVELPLGELAASAAAGRRAVEQASTTLERLLERESSPRANVFDAFALHADWRSFFRAQLGSLEGLSQIVLAARAGVIAPAETLQEIGDRIGRSSERARQLEGEALDALRAASDLLDHVAEKLVALAGEPFVRAENLGDRDPFFAVEEDALECFEFFVERLLTCSIHVVRCEEGAFVTRFTSAELKGRITAVRGAARGLRYPLPASDRDTALAGSLGWASDVTRAFASIVEHEWSCDGDRLVAFGRTTRRERILTFVRAAASPVTVAELQVHFGRSLPWSELFYVRHAVVTLPERIADLAMWKERLAASCADVMQRLDPARQWTTDELMTHLGVVMGAALPDWLNSWSLGSALRGADEVRYLGRNVVALPDGGGGERVQILETACAMLEQAGAPMREVELVAFIRGIRGLKEGTWMTERERTPMVILDGGHIGLTPRDVPGGEPEIARFVEALYARLWARERGLGWSEVVVELRRLGGPCATWPIDLARSLARHDGRFRCISRAGVGLGEWETARVQTQVEILGALLDHHGGRVPVELALRALTPAGRRQLARSTLESVARELGARIAEGVVTTEEAPSRGPRSLRGRERRA